MSAVQVTQNPSIELPEVPYSLTSLGCTEQSYYWDCSASKEELLKTCDRIIPSTDLGGLTPRVSMVECQKQDKDFGSNKDVEEIRGDGCMMPVLIQYLAFDGKELHLLKTPEEMAAYFAPIDTSEEALSYAVARSGDYPLYEISLPSSYRTFVSELETTYVKEAEGGYKVHLFSYGVCGCGPHAHFSEDYFVSTEGEMTTINSEKIYEDPTEDGLCVD